MNDLKGMQSISHCQTKPLQQVDFRTLSIFTRWYYIYVHYSNDIISNSYITFNHICVNITTCGIKRTQTSRHMYSPNIEAILNSSHEMIFSLNPFIVRSPQRHW